MINMDEDFSQLSDDVICKDEKRAICAKCSRPQRVCWCPYLPSKRIEISGKVIVLQHPDEEKRNLKTGPMLFHGLAQGQCLIYRGKKFPNSKHTDLHNILKEPNTFVLYPGPKSRSVEEVAKSHIKGTPYNFVLIDGTWPQAKSMYHHSPFLHSLPQVSLPDCGASQYVIRTQPAEGCLSTVESAAAAISFMEQDKSIVDELVHPLKALCTFQLNYGAVEHHDKVTLLELGLYRKPVGKRTLKFLKQTSQNPLLNDLKPNK